MTMHCREAEGRFSDYYDGGLAPAERHMLEQHLRDCSTCRGEYEHYTTSLQILRETGPTETTDVFIEKVREAAADHVEREELFRQTAVARPAWNWRPLAVAAAALMAFGLGYWTRGPGTVAPAPVADRPPERMETVPLPVVAKTPVDEKKVLQDHGLVEVDGKWVQKSVKDALDRGMVILGGEAMDRSKAAEKLAGEFPSVTPAEAAPPAVVTEADVLQKHGLVVVGDKAVSKAALDKWAKGYVQVGADEWKKPDELKDAFIQENGLVEFEGRLMTVEEARRLAARKVVQRPAGAAASNEVTQALEGLEIAAPVTHRGVTIHLLKSAGAAEGVGASQGVVTEAESFFSVAARNTMEVPVRFLVGEILEGGRCNRVVATDTRVAAGATGSVPVLCAEPGAWRASDKFDPPARLASPAIRRALAREEGQGAVWRLLSKSFADVSGFREAFVALPDREPSAVGLVVSIGGKVDHVELFSDHATLKAYFDRIVMSTMAEAPEAGSGDGVEGVKRFLESLFLCAYEPQGEGFALKRGDEWVGRAWVASGRLAHALFYASPAGTPGGVPSIPKEKLNRIFAEYEARMKGAGAARKIATLREAASLGVPEATAFLAGHLQETDVSVRSEAVRALGASGDPRAAGPLIAFLERSRKDAVAAAEAAHALAVLGDERAVDPLLRQLDMGDAELGRIACQALPELLLRLHDREPLEKAVSRLVSLYERMEGVSDAAAQGLPSADLVRSALQKSTGKTFESASSCRRWWNDRDARAKFLKERAGP